MALTARYVLCSGRNVESLPNSDTLLSNPLPPHTPSPQPPSHRFIIARLDEALLPGHEVLFEDLIRTDSILSRVNSLFHPEGLNRLIFTYYSPDSKDVPELPSGDHDEGKEEKTSDTLKDTDVTGYAMAGNVETGWLLVTQGDDIAVTNRAVFFMKTKAKSGIDPTKSTDAAMTYGVIDSPLRNLEVVMRNIYRPLLQVSDNKTWGKASAEEQVRLQQRTSPNLHPHPILTPPASLAPPKTERTHGRSGQLCAQP